MVNKKKNPDDVKDHRQTLVLNKAEKDLLIRTSEYLRLTESEILRQGLVKLARDYGLLIGDSNEAQL